MAPFPRGLLLVLSAPSGAGKTTLARALTEQTPGARFSVSTTTRPPRGEEREGVDYFFVQEEEFKARVAAGFFAEWAQVHGHFYGSPQSAVEAARREDSLAVFDIDVQGGLRLKAHAPDCILVFVMPPSFEELERRLRNRRTDNAQAIEKRLCAAKEETRQGLEFYDYIVVNDELPKALERLKAIVVAEKCRRGRAALNFQAEP